MTCAWVRTGAARLVELRNDASYGHSISSQYPRCELAREHRRHARTELARARAGPTCSYGNSCGRSMAGIDFPSSSKTSARIAAGMASTHSRMLGIRRRRVPLRRTLPKTLSPATLGVLIGREPRLDTRFLQSDVLRPA